MGDKNGEHEADQPESPPSKAPKVLREAEERSYVRADFSGIR